MPFVKKILLLLTLFSPLFSEEETVEYLTVEQYLATKPKEGEIDKKHDSYPVTSTKYPITPKVNVITGDYSESEVDLVVAASDPLSFRRFYNQFAPHDYRYGCWRYNPEHAASANFECSTMAQFISFGDVNGEVIGLFNRNGTNFSFDLSRDKQFTYANGQKHPLNAKAYFKKLHDPKNERRWVYYGEIIDGEGGRKSFTTEMHGWLSLLEIKKRRKMGFFPQSSEYFDFTKWTPYQAQIREEKKPNGNVVCYEYENWKDEIYPTFDLLSSIKVYNASKTQLISSLNFKYRRNKNGAVYGVTITGSDDRKVVLGHQGTRPIFLTEVTSSENAPIDYTYSHDLLEKIERPEGRVFITKYVSQLNNKVAAQYAPVGPNGELCPIAQFTYLDNATEVLDAEGNKTIYRYDENKRITTFEVYQGGSLYRQERYLWDPLTGNLLSKTVENPSGTPLFKQEYTYDIRHNLIEEKKGNEKENYTIYRTYSEDGFNLKLSERDNFGKHITYQYYQNTNLPYSEFLYEGNKIVKRVFYFYNDCAIKIGEIIDDGSSDKPEILQDVTYRKIITITPKLSHPCFGLPEIVEEKTIDSSGREVALSKIQYTYAPSGKVLKEEHFDCNGAHCFSIKNEYDEKERLIATFDQLKHKRSFNYDLNNNLIFQSGPQKDLTKNITYDKANRPCIITQNGLTCTQGYDKLGQVIYSTDECGCKTGYKYDALGRPIQITLPDGGTLLKEYDILGNVIKEIDPNGDITTFTYHFLGKPTSISHPDGSYEQFSYRNDGALLAHTDKNGATTHFTYDVFGNVTEERVYSSQGELLKSSSAIFSAFNCLSTTNSEGLTTIFSYDFSGKKIAETTLHKQTLYFYDSLSRLHKTQTGDVVYIQEYDAKNNVIEKRTEDVAGTLYKKENFEYDAAGNCTLVTTALGSNETQYNEKNEIIALIDAIGEKTLVSYDYQGGGLTKTTTFPKKNQTVSFYNSRGFEVETTILNPKKEVLHKTTRRFDRNGNTIESIEHVYEGSELKKTVTNAWEFGPGNHLVALIEGGTKKTTYTYEKGRLKTLTKPDGTTLYSTYDNLGRLLRYQSIDFDYVYTYDSGDRVLSVTDKKTNATTTRSYSIFGELIQETIGTNISIKNSYDKLGRRVAITLPDKSEIKYEYQCDNLYSVTRKNLTYTYSERDLDGNPTLVTLPSTLGKITMERDALSRLKKTSSPYFTAIFPKGAYDANGNLTRYTYIDALGSTDNKFTYDDLNQLTSENEHTYLFDSLNNRVEKDDASFSFNALSQITNPGYKYDANGNMISDGEFTFVYDSLDRVVAIKKKNLEIQFTYDPFHRRLSKAVSGPQGPQRPLKTEYYLWDGNNEIGSLDKEGRIRELRVLGEGFGAEIGAATIIELNQQSYIPIHDHRGSLVALIDAFKKIPIQTYRYTAFGELSQETTSPDYLHQLMQQVTLAPTKPHSPWLYSSKRIDPETGFLFFGRRYYSPTLGRWLTPDPQGFDDGPNLYAYVHNNPAKFFDLYGLKSHGILGIINWLLQVLAPTFNLGTSTSSYHPQMGCSHRYDTFEDKLPNKSKNLAHAGETRLHRLGIGFVNGMNTTEDQLKAYGETLANYAGRAAVNLTYNATNGFFKDLYRCFFELKCKKLMPSAAALIEKWKHELKTADKYLQICHSEGAIIVRNALSHCPAEIRSKIHVVAIAPAAYINKRLCASVIHYVSKRDFVPMLDARGRRECADTVVVLKPHRNAAFWDHGIDSPTYQEAIQYHISSFTSGGFK